VTPVDDAQAKELSKKVGEKNRDSSGNKSGKR
jgi:hypothetical protein